jgi:hypothetical protein
VRWYAPSNRDKAYIDVLSIGEQCAVCVVLDRPDLAKEHFGTLLECADRVGPEWLAASLFVQHNGWNDPPADDDER